MKCVEHILPEPVRQDRAAVARERALVARELLADCHLCAHHCGVNRSAGVQGLCHAGVQTRFFSAQVEVSDELELIPTFAIAPSGCNLRCDFCITRASSWNPRAGSGFSPQAMAMRARRALAEGARTVMLMGGEPTIHLPAALEFAAEMPATSKLVWKTNAYSSAEARDLLDGIFDVWVADFKFGNDTCAQHLARIPDYVRVVQENLLWANEHSRLIVRHLLMPGHLDCCWKSVAGWLADELPGVKVSLRAGFWPVVRSAGAPELRRLLTASETAQAGVIARKFALRLVG